MHGVHMRRRQGGFYYITFRVLGVIMRRTWVGHLKGALGSNEKIRRILSYHIKGALGSNEKNMGMKPELCLGF